MNKKMQSYKSLNTSTRRVGLMALPSYQIRFCMASAVTAISLLHSMDTVVAFSHSANVSSRIRQHSSWTHSSVLWLHSSNIKTVRPTFSKRPASQRSQVTPKKVPSANNVIFIQKPKSAEITESFDPFRVDTEATVATTEQARGYVKEVTTSSDGEQKPSTSSFSFAATATPKPSVNSFNLFSDVWKARFLLLAAAALYGTNFTIVKILNEQLPIGASTSLRFTLASLATLPFLLPALTTATNVAEGAVGNSAKKALTTWSEVLPVVLTGMEVGLFNSFAYICQAIGLETVDASKSAFICSLSVVIVPILDFVLKQKSLSVQSIAGLICAVIGVGLLELSGTSFSVTPGDLFTFAQPLFFGIGFWKMEQAMRKFPAEARRITASQVLMVAIVSVSNCWLLQPQIGAGVQPPSLDQMLSWISDPRILGALIWTGLITTALTQYMETLALKTLSASEATLWFSTEPLWGAGFASVVGGERLGLNAIYGAGLILSGCAISTAQKEEQSCVKLTCAIDDEEEKDSSADNVGSDVQYTFGAGVASLALQVQAAEILEGCAEGSLAGQLQNLADVLPPS